MKGDASARATHRRNRGAVLLARIGETQSKIATRTKCTRVQVAYFESGQRVPGPLNRARFKKEYGIPETAWDEEPTAIVPPPQTGPVDESIAGRVARLQRTIDQIQEEAQTDPETTRREKVAVLKGAIEALALLAKITGESQEMSEARLIRLPAMRRLVEQLLKALEPWPEAMRAAGEVLKGSHDDNDTVRG
jgi:transcriptional regulator with XRE-family HTH domain